MELSLVKKKIAEAIEENKEEIIKIGRELLEIPELGYFEEKTSSYVRGVFDRLGISYEHPLALTGVKAKVGKKTGPTIAIIGELDAIKCVGHKFEGEGGAAHACGHNAQLAAMLGVAIGLKKSGILEELSGQVVFFAVPSEEFCELEARGKLKIDGKIEYFGGKQQLICDGAFDDVDMAIMVHAQPNEEKAKVFTRGYNLGFLAKNVSFYGKASHGSKPHEGTNALNAAALALLGVHANRETFEEKDRIRIHPIITKGGDVVNSVPDEVLIETYVRGATLSAIKKGNDAFERSCQGAAQMIGAKVSWENIPGYLPIAENEELSKAFEKNASEIIGEENIVRGYEITGSTDMGDLSNIMPVIQPSVGGFSGNLHSKEFKVADENAAYVIPALIIAQTVAELLYNDAKEANKILDSYKALLTKDEYINYLKGE